mmetsp:Transcript_4883/g.7849  ORF Transcript_4883/g.7849 Transcript_4883/m.7849 type:complete len:107 (+) Transcript_4883:848-1168(+)
MEKSKFLKTIENYIKDFSLKTKIETSKKCRKKLKWFLSDYLYFLIKNFANSSNSNKVNTLHFNQLEPLLVNSGKFKFLIEVFEELVKCQEEEHEKKKIFITKKKGI